MEAVNVQPNEFTYTALMKVATHEDGPERAASYFKQMKERGLKPTIVTYGTLKTAWYKAGKYQQVLEAFKEMQAAGFVGNVVDYTQAFTCLSKLDRTTEIEPMLEDMLGHNVKLNKICERELENALGSEEFNRLREKFRLHRFLGESVDQEPSKIQRIQEAKLKNMQLEQTKSALRDRRI